MAKKSEEIIIEPMRSTTVRLELTGITPLMLHGRSRYYVQSECWKQNHDKGEKMPEIYCQGKNIYEGLITGIHWEKPITFHDDDIMLYTKEELENYLTNNRPCILGQAFKKSFVECFTTFLKESTGKNGTDIKRALSIDSVIHPVDFESHHIESSIVPTKGIGGSTVVCNANVFEGWKTSIEVSCPDIVFPIRTVVQLIETTGKYIGIGSQRANDYGKYRITELEQVSTLAD